MGDFKVKNISVKYREPSPEEIADRESRKVIFDDGSKGIIQNPRDENGNYIGQLTILLIPEVDLNRDFDVSIQDGQIVFTRKGD